MYASEIKETNHSKSQEPRRMTVEQYQYNNRVIAKDKSFYYLTKIAEFHSK